MASLEGMAVLGKPDTRSVPGDRLPQHLPMVKGITRIEKEQFHEDEVAYFEALL